MVRLENVLKISLQDVLKMSWRHLEDVFKTSWRRLEDTWKRSWRRFEDVLKMSWRRLEDALKTYSQDKYIGLDQDVLWRRKAKANIFVLIKTSWRRLEDVFWRRRRKASSRRLHQDECLLGLVFICTFCVFPWNTLAGVFTLSNLHDGCIKIIKSHPWYFI